MDRNFYYGAEATMVGGSARFSAAINSDPASFGLDGDQCADFAANNAQLQSAYQSAIEPHTRTPVVIAEKNRLIKVMQRKAILLTRIILATPSVTDAQLISLGLLPRSTRKRRNVPSKAPLVQVISVKGRVVQVRVCDQNAQSRRTKPFGARGAELFSFVGEQPADDPRAFAFQKLTTRTTTQLTFPNEVPSGSTCWLSARWVSARGETSIASAPIPFTLTGGVIAPASPMKIAA